MVSILMQCAGSSSVFRRRRGKADCRRKIDEVLDKRTERLRADVDKQIKAANERADKAEAFSNKFRDRVLGDAIRAAASKLARCRKHPTI